MFIFVFGKNKYKNNNDVINYFGNIKLHVVNTGMSVLCCQHG